MGAAGQWSAWGRVGAAGRGGGAHVDPVDVGEEDRRRCGCDVDSLGAGLARHGDDLLGVRGRGWVGLGVGVRARVRVGVGVKVGVGVGVGVRVRVGAAWPRTTHLGGGGAAHDGVIDEEDVAVDELRADGRELLTHL